MYDQWDRKFIGRSLWSLGVLFAAILPIVVKIAETEAYIQTIALKKTLELISLDRRRGIEEEDKEFEVEKSVKTFLTPTMPSLFQLLYSFVFLSNAVLILHDERFLTKIGLPLAPDARHVLGSKRVKVVDLLRAVRTVIGLPLIVCNGICIVYEIVLG